MPTVIASGGSSVCAGDGYLIVNGRRYNFAAGDGDTIEVIGNNIYINGRRFRLDESQGTTTEKEYELASKIEIHLTIAKGGENAKLETNAGKVIVNGSLRAVCSTSGDVQVNGNVTGNASSTSGDVTVTGYVQGSAVSTSGDIRAQSILGSCSTVSGDISGRRN